MLLPPSPRSLAGVHLPGDKSVLEAYSWQRKSAVSSVQDPVACFCATSEGEEGEGGRGREQDLLVLKYWFRLCNPENNRNGI